MPFSRKLSYLLFWTFSWRKPQCCFQWRCFSVNSETSPPHAGGRSTRILILIYGGNVIQFQPTIPPTIGVWLWLWIPVPRLKSHSWGALWRISRHSIVIGWLTRRSIAKFAETFHEKTSGMKPWMWDIRPLLLSNQVKSIKYGTKEWSPVTLQEDLQTDVDGCW